MHEENKPEPQAAPQPQVIDNRHDFQPPKPNRHHSKRKIILILVVVLAVVGAAVAWMLLKEPKQTATNTVAPVTDNPKVEEPKTIKISVAEKGKLVLPNGYADPTIVSTTAGYRMYVNKQSGGPSGYYTFTSPDGKTWTKEKDMVIPGVSTGRAVVLPNGIRIYYPGPQPINPTDPPADMFSSFSTDGLNFTKDAGVRLKPSSDKHYVEGPTVFQLSDKSWRMYFNENTTAAGNQRDGKIWGASSKDGLQWTRDEKPTITSDDVEAKMNQPWEQVLHPFVIKNPKGGYLMFYNAHSEVFAASSEDGLKWTKLGQIGVHGADVDGYFQEDGTLRIYYGDFSEETGGVVYTAVLKIEQ